MIFHTSFGNDEDVFREKEKGEENRMLPEKFLERMQEMLGEEFDAFLESYGQERFYALRVNPLKMNTSKDVSGEKVLSGIFSLTPVSWEPNGYYYAKEDMPGRHPYHEAGVYYIQEPSAMAVVPLLEVKPGERVLDLCAAPGGKSTQIAGYLAGEGLLVSNEIHPVRAKTLSENIERMGVRNVCVTNESPLRLAERFCSWFDKILVDAPCSGEGMFRKNEAACQEWSPENVELCARRQDEILNCAARMLRPGGRMVYSTCTFSVEENEGSIDRFLQRHPEFSLIHSLRLWPHKIRGEGHFAAVLQKSESVAEGYDPVAYGGLERGICPKDRQLDAWWDFWQQNRAEETGFGEMPKGVYLRFKDHLYLAPEQFPVLKDLKVLRPGLHLGTFKKNRFEPSHALALTLTGRDIRHVCQLSAKDRVAAEYLNGQTFSREGENGWYLLTVDGYSIGWGKLTGNIMKNHYPKGLRK